MATKPIDLDPETCYLAMLEAVNRGPAWRWHAEQCAAAMLRWARDPDSPVLVRRMRRRYPGWVADVFSVAPRRLWEDLLLRKEARP